MPDLLKIGCKAVLLLLLGSRAVVAFDFEDLTASERRLDDFVALVRNASETVGTDAFHAEMMQLLPDAGRISNTANGPDAPPAPVATAGSEAEIELVDIRILLTQLAIQTGTNDHLSLYRALGTGDRNALLIRGGRLTLADLVARVRESAFSSVLTRGDNGVLSNVPVVIWSDATLTLEAGERLDLNRETGAFALSFGRFEARNASIIATGGTNPGETRFRPFVLATATGSLDIIGTEISGLGYGHNPVFGGVTYVTGGLLHSGASSRIERNLVTDTGTIALINAIDSSLSGNRIDQARGQAFLVSGGSAVRVTDNAIIGGEGNQAIRISGTAENVLVEGNVIVGGAGTGIFVDGGASFVDISGNIIAGLQGAGIGLKTTACSIVSGNLVAGNLQKGVSVRESYRIELKDNHVLSNLSAGISVSDQPPGGLVDISGNLLSGNRSGLRGAEAARIVLSDNDLASQLPRILSGDLAQSTGRFLSEKGLAGREVVLTSPAAMAADERAQGPRTGGFRRCLEQEAG